jgi:signal transduction histidine kinase
MPQPVAILAIDDNDADLELISVVLGNEGYQVSCAHNAREAERHIANGFKGVLLIDLILPDKSGLEVLRAAQRQDSQAVGIVLTASLKKQDAIDSMLQGAFDFLTKPVDQDLLKISVRRAVQHYQLKQDLAKKEGAPLEACRDFLADVLHEMKSPLSVIHGYSSFLMADGGETAVKTGLNAIHQSARQLEGLVEDFMDTERLRGGKVKLEREALPVNGLLSDTVAAYKVLAERRDISMRYGIIGDVDTKVHGDLQRVRQILGNLLSNALKFTASSGRIGLWARVETNEVVFCIEDSGIGMQAAEVARIFERRHQINTSIPNRRGLGLGLSIARELVEYHGGRIWAESETDKGSRFYFTLPVTGKRPDPAKFREVPNTSVRRIP